MKTWRAGATLLAVQLVLVLSVAGKYIYERITCPRVWVPTAQYDPQMPLRGRYFALQPVVNACALPRSKAKIHEPYKFYRTQRYEPGSLEWTNVTLVAEKGHLVPRLVNKPVSPDGILTISYRDGASCTQARISQSLEYFIPEHAKEPFPLEAGQELWMEVTVPPSGPPRPIQLAISSKDGFKPLKFE